MNASMQNQYKLAVDGYLKEKRPKQNLPIDSVRELDRVVDGVSEHVLQTKVGSDIYERITDINSQVRFMKNEKPITAVTFNFETKRKNEGVSKKDRKVKNHSRYKPLQKK
jgi:predicted transcriptional regulator